MKSFFIKIFTEILSNRRAQYFLDRVFTRDTHVFSDIIHLSLLDKIKRNIVLDKFDESDTARRDLIDYIFKSKRISSGIIQSNVSDEDKLSLLMEELHNSEITPSKLELMYKPSKKFYRNLSFSQCGEDIIVKFIVERFNIKDFSYIDIGAFDPLTLSNTALFYLEGYRGINIEPNPDQIELFKKFRPEDINIQIGIGTTSEQLTYYRMDVPTLNTFSGEEASLLEKEGHRIVGKESFPVKTLSDVLETYNAGVFPKYMTLDAEGIDELIFNSIDFKTNYPLIICVETVLYSRSSMGEKNKELIDTILSKGYLQYADTNINTIFIHNSLVK